MSDAPMDPTTHGPDEPGPDLAWLSDEPTPATPEDPARWPTAAEEMVPLPGFILDDERELVPVGGAGTEQPAPAVGDRARGSGRRVRLVFTWTRATAAIGVAAGMALTTAIVYGGLGLPSPEGSNSATPAGAGAPASGPSGAVDAEAMARLRESVRAAQRRDQQAAATRRKARRRTAARRERERAAPSAAEETTRQVAATASPPAASQAAPATPADPWAHVPGAVREFEPGPWNLGGSAS